MNPRQPQTSIDPAASLAERIFPSGEPRDGRILRMDLVGSWESQLIGVGRLTAFISPRLLTASHAADDMGLYVVFLQRHRVEIGLKLVLERTATPIMSTHAIDSLRTACEVACQSVGHTESWRDFIRSQREYIDLIHAIDPGAAAFRYPVDKDSQEWNRRELVDLEQLELAGTAFEDDVLALVRRLASLEPVPVADEAEETALELRDLALACRSMIRTQEHAMASLRRERDRLSRGRVARARRDDSADVYAAAASVVDVTAALATRAEEMCTRIVETCGVQLPPAPAYVPLVETPRMTPTLDGAVMRAQQEAQMKWFVDGFVRCVRPLMRAVGAVEQRSVDWSTPVARQLHLDVTRFRTRLGVARNTRLNNGD